MPRIQPVDTSPVDAAAHLLAGHLVTELAEGELEPSLVHIRPVAGGVDLGVKPLDGARPADLLLGFVAPPEWHALGVAVHGWAYDLTERFTGGGRHSRVHVVSLVTRSGETIHRSLVPDDAARTATLDDPAEPVEGEQVDLLRCALEQPTAPPPCGATIYLAIEWLDRIARDGHLPPAPVAGLEWGFLRHEAAMGRREAPGLTMLDASWLDDGAFARWILARLPLLSDARANALDAIGIARQREILETLADLGVPEVAWPEPGAA